MSLAQVPVSQLICKLMSHLYVVSICLPITSAKASSGCGSFRLRLPWCIKHDLAHVALCKFLSKRRLQDT